MQNLPPTGLLFSLVRFHLFSSDSGCMNDHDLLLKKITEETYQDDVSSSSPVSLVNYFEKRLNEVDFLSLKTYLTNEEILFLPMVYSEVTKCYRVILGQSEIDFPSNWSIFNKFGSEYLLHVKAETDEDFLCEIFLSLVGEVKIIVLATDENGPHLIFLSSENSEKHFEWIENYFASKTEQEQKKAS